MSVLKQEIERPKSDRWRRGGTQARRLDNPGRGGYIMYRNIPWCPECLVHPHSRYRSIASLRADSICCRPFLFFPTIQEELTARG